MQKKGNLTRLEARKLTNTFVITLIASILICINGAWIIANNGPILISTYPAQELNDVKNATGFWGRIALGNSQLLNAIGAPLWLALGVALLICSIAIYIKPIRQKQLGLPIIALSVLSLPIGGGFALGAILGLIGGAIATEWPKPFSETFAGQLLRAARMDSQLYRNNAGDPRKLRTAAFVVMLVGFLSGLGNSLYVFNVNTVIKGLAPNATQSATDPAKAVLVNGVVLWDLSSLMTAIGSIGIAVIQWLVLAFALYIVGVKISGYESSFDRIARTLAYAYVPVSLQILLLIMFSNEPMLSSTWPLLIFMITTAWLVMGLIVAVKEMFAITSQKALGTLALGGATYWLANNIIFVQALKLPGVSIEFTPESTPVILFLAALATLAAAVLGVFERK